MFPVHHPDARPSGNGDEHPKCRSYSPFGSAEECGKWRKERRVLFERKARVHAPPATDQATKEPAKTVLPWGRPFFSSFSLGAQRKGHPSGRRPRLNFPATDQRFRGCLTQALFPQKSYREYQDEEKQERMKQDTGASRLAFPRGCVGTIRTLPRRFALDYIKNQLFHVFNRVSCSIFCFCLANLKLDNHVQ